MLACVLYQTMFSGIVTAVLLATNSATGCDYTLQFPTLNDSVYTVQEDTNISLQFRFKSSCAVYDGLKITVGKRNRVGFPPAITCQILHTEGRCHVTGDHCKCLSHDGMYLLVKSVDPEDNTTWVWWNNDEAEKPREVTFNIQQHVSTRSTTRSTTITSPTTITTNSVTYTTPKRTTHEGVESKQPSEDVTTGTVLQQNGRDMSTRSSQPIDDQVDDTAPTSSGGSVAGVVIALLLIGVVIVVVVYRVRTKKTDDPVWRFFITAKRAGVRQVNNYHDVLPHQDRPSGDDDDEVVMIDNVVYGGATAMSTKPPPADYEEDAVLKNARKKVPVKEDKEEMVMIDNIVYEGGKPVPKTAQVAENDYEDIKCLQQPTVTSASADTDHQGDDDEEVVMIDNVAYEGTRLQKDNYQHIRAPQRSPKGSQANNGSVNHDRTSKDDEVVMIDNILYEGGNAATRGFPLAGHDYEEIESMVAP